MSHAAALMKKEMPIEVARVLGDRSKPLSVSEVADAMNLLENGSDGRLTSAARLTIWRWLTDARKQNLVELVGVGRGAKWQASQELRLTSLRAQLAMPVESRPLVTYEEGFLDEYTPNETFYLTQHQRSRLHGQCTPGSAEFSTLNQHDQSLFLCGLSYASSSLEGNPYDLAATIKLLESGLVKEGASPTETTMVLNHHEAVRYLVDNVNFPARKNDVSISARDIKSLHGLLSAYLLKDPMMCGAIRRAPVKIQQSSYVPMAVQDSLERALHLITQKAARIKDPYEQAFFLLVHLPYLQPFEDCNKRTARVACNIPLLKGGVVPMSWMDVDPGAYITGVLGVYERTNPALLAEVFVDGYMRSAERFSIMQRSCAPNETRVRYRSEIRTIVRSIVLEGDVSLSSIQAEDVDSVTHLVHEDLMLLRAGNPAIVVRLGLQDGDIRAWMRKEGTGQDGTLLATEGDAANQPRERMRG